MELYFIRHSDAENGTGKPDNDRELTESGKLKIKRAAEAWKTFNPLPDYIISSPLIRAVQTAEIVKKEFNFNEDIIKEHSLISGSRLEDLIAFVNNLEGKIFLIGHQPDFSNAVSSLISTAGAAVEFKKTSIAKISFSAKAKLGRGTLEFLIPAKAFQKEEFPGDPF
jgi:phosphohistidine phosphatase